MSSESAFKSDHLRIEHRSLVMHQAIAVKLIAHPEYLDIAQANLKRWMSMNEPVPNCLFEWRNILEQPFERIVSQIVEQNERMTRLRQSSPFSGILSPRERWSIYESFTTRAYYSSSRINC